MTVDLLRLAYTGLAIGIIFPCVQLAFGLWYAGVMSCSNDALMLPTTWLTVMGAVGVTVHGVGILLFAFLWYTEHRKLLSFLLLYLLTYAAYGIFDVVGHYRRSGALA